LWSWFSQIQVSVIWDWSSESSLLDIYLNLMRLKSTHYGVVNIWIILDLGLDVGDLLLPLTSVLRGYTILSYLASKCHKNKLVIFLGEVRRELMERNSDKIMKGESLPLWFVVSNWVSLATTCQLPQKSSYQVEDVPLL